MTRWIMNLTWDDAPHLSDEDKKKILEGCSPHERDAVSKGLPSLGSGAIYPVFEADVVVEPFKIPYHWPRCYALDVGWNKTAALWGAYDPKSDIWYLYSEYYRGQAEPSVHADAIRARGTWMAGVIDCHSKARSQKNGEQLLEVYLQLGLNLATADNGPGTLEAGILSTYQRLSSGRLKIFNHLHNTLAEFRIYRRDKNGRVVDKDDHLMDCMRFIVISGEKVMDVPPLDEEESAPPMQIYAQGRSDICGY
jgi:hypothetical protein